MLNQHTLEKLHALRLTGMAQALTQQRTQPQTEALGFEQRLGLLVDQEILYRDNRRLARLLKAAKLRVDACVEDIDYRHPRGIDRSELDLKPWPAAEAEKRFLRHFSALLAEAGDRPA